MIERSLAATLDQVEALYDKGLYLQAYQLGTQIAPITKWQSAKGRVMAGRLGANLGAQRLALVMHNLAFRENPNDPESRYFYVWSVLNRKGIYDAWVQFSKFDQDWDSDLETLSDWYSMKAYLLGAMRDFEPAEAALRDALDLTPERAWTWVQASSLYHFQDRHDKSLEAVLHALELSPFYRPAVQAAATHLVQSDRLDEALKLLSDASNVLESGDVFAQLASLQLELNQYDEARKNFLRVREFYPLVHLSKDKSKWLEAALADVAYYCQEYDEAIRLAEESNSEYYKRIAAELKKGTEGHKEVILPVGFVRQHHVTCAPATLTAIANYWKLPVHHLEIAEEICYDGTPGHSERKWASENGFYAREFRVTWETLVALLDRGVPFTLTTIDSGSGHLQGCIGYDSLRRTIFVRDSNTRFEVEYRIDEFIEHYRSTGPRGMVLVPTAERHRLDGIELPDAEIYDRYHELELALQAHKRNDEAARLLAEMQAKWPEERLTLFAKRSVAAYDGNQFSLYEAYESLVKSYPDDVNLTLGMAYTLQELGRISEKVELLKTFMAKRPDPLIVSEYAKELSNDSRELKKTEEMARLAVRYRPSDGACYELLANTLWTKGEKARALELYRFATCVSDKDELLARSYFSASRSAGQTESALKFLQGRVEANGRKSSMPHRTLALAYDLLDQHDKLFATLDKAIEVHPKDGDLLLVAARICLSYGKWNNAQKLLEKAKSVVKETQWLRTAATWYLQKGENSNALKLWKRLLAKEPLAGDAIRMVANLLELTEGEAAAIAFSKAYVAKFPFHYQTRLTRIEWAKRESNKVLEQTIRELLETYADDAWARRELAICLLSQKRFAEAIDQAELGCKLEPSNPASFGILAHCYSGNNDLKKAEANFKKALKLSVDYDTAIDGLLDLCNSKRERTKVLDFVLQELRSQVVHGDGVLAFRNRAADTYSPEQLEVIFEEFLKARPDLWQSWSAIVQHYLDTKQTEKSAQLVEKAIKKFPLLPRFWMLRAQVYEQREDSKGEIQSLKSALTINPSWPEAWRCLAISFIEQEDFVQAEKSLQRGLRVDPTDCTLLLTLAKLHWQQKQQKEAVAEIQKIVEISPGYQVAWDLLQDWSREIRNPELPIQVARKLTEDRPDESRSWLILAELLDAPDKAEERLRVLDRALECNPKNIEAIGLKAWQLGELGRYDDALKACEPKIFASRIPFDLRCRKAQIVAMQGEIDKAIELLKQVTKEDSEFAWAWSLLCDWYRNLDRIEEYHHAAQQLARIRPNVSISHGYMYDSLMKLEREKEAIEALKSAFRVDPSYMFAVRRLIEHYCKEGQFDEAEVVCRKSNGHIPGYYSLAFSARVAREQGNIPLFHENVEAMIRSAADDNTVYDDAFAGLKQEEFTGLVAILDRYLLDETAALSVGYFWGFYTSSICGPSLFFQQLSTRKMTEQNWEFAVLSIFDKKLDFPWKDSLNNFIESEKSRLFKLDRTWLAIGHYWFIEERYGESTEWLSEWESRSNGLEALFWNSISFRELKQWERGVQALEKVMSQPPSDIVRIAKIWYILDLILAERFKEAIDLFSEIDPDSLSKFYRAFYDSLKGFFDWFRSGPARHNELFPGMATIFKRISEPHADSPLLMEGQKRLLKLAARLQTDIFRKIYYRWFFK